jgi:putative ABC transport system permease protein
MSILMTLRIAFKALGRNKMRTALTMLGMIIGVAAVIAVVALGTGAQQMIEDQVKTAGTNLVTVLAGSTNQGGVRSGAGGTSRLTPEDVALLRQLPEVQYAAESVGSRQQLIYANQNWNTMVEGTNVDMPEIRSWTVKFGSFFTDDDVRSAAKVIVLGSNVSDQLFGEGIDPTDTQIRVRNQIFKIVGVMSSKGAGTGGASMDDQVFIPYTTVLKKLLGQTFIQRIYVSAASADDIDGTAAAITAALRNAHGTDSGEDDFTVQTLEDIVALRSQTTNTMKQLLAGIAGVSLVVGGIGIMNIMLVSVTERTREIGLRLAIGARSFDVLLQFLIEAIVISIAGGGFGIAIGYLVALFLNNYQGMAATVPLNAVITAVGFSAGIGIFFGFYPARKAAGLDPIDALRFE